MLGKKIIVASVMAGFVALITTQGAMAAQKERDTGYVGVGAIEWKSKGEGLPSYNSTTARIRGGYQFNDYVALEGHFAAGGSETEDSGIEHELKYVAGAYLRFSTPAARDLKAYALLGGSKVEVNHINPFVDGDIAVTSPSYGVGIEVLLMGGFSLKLDAMRYADTSELELDVVGAEFGLRF